MQLSAALSLLFYLKSAALIVALRTNVAFEIPSLRRGGLLSAIILNVPTAEPTVEPTAAATFNPTPSPTKEPTPKPTILPSSTPTTQPVAEPTVPPSGSPSSSPTLQPVGAPTRQPTAQPYSLPSAIPTFQPISGPTCQPTSSPTSCPTLQSTEVPSVQPLGIPTYQPTMQPQFVPTSVPTAGPSVSPTSQPSHWPSVQPTSTPSSSPSTQPSVLPSTQPFSTPTTEPSSQPTALPTSPTGQPIAAPTASPSRTPSSQPSLQPFVRPTSIPSASPSVHPSSIPSSVPSSQPSIEPTSLPTLQPNGIPTAVPSRQPSSQPTGFPSHQPFSAPTSQPTAQPSASPTNPTGQPVAEPTNVPSSQPSSQPSTQPFLFPTSIPSCQPTSVPTAQSTSTPSSRPSSQPVSSPSAQPTQNPTTSPTMLPTSQPSSIPTLQPILFPTSAPTSVPSGTPTRVPTMQPAATPTSIPSLQPTCQPSLQPSSLPSSQPSSEPTQPTSQPTEAPSGQPTVQPSKQPTADPTTQPSSQPSGRPSTMPSRVPTEQPFSLPTTQPSNNPTSLPTIQPSEQPSSDPTSQPSHQPSGAPSTNPSSLPTLQPFTFPTAVPSVQPSSSPTSVPTSSEPTSVPTSRPSKYPTTSSPTFTGATNPPTGIPSSHPSYQLNDYLDNQAYQWFLGNSSLYKHSHNYISYSTFHYKGISINGTCRDWSQFLDTRLQVPTEASLRFVQFLAWFNSYDFLTGEYSYVEARCSSRALLSQFLNAIDRRMPMQFDCERKLWRVMVCDDEVIVCINCKDTCVSTETCPGNSFVANPCHSGVCASTYTAAGALVAVKYEYAVRYPQFMIPPSIRVVKETEVVVSSTIDRAGTVYCRAFSSVETANASSFSDIRDKHFQAVVYIGGEVSVTITGLTADTDYWVRCVTESTLLYSMPSYAASTVVAVTTACCRRVEIVSSSSFFLNSSLKEMQLRLSSRPRFDVSINITVSNSNGCAIGGEIGSDANSAIVQPSNFFFPSGSNVQRVTFVLLAGTGCFSMKADIVRSVDVYNNTLAIAEVMVLNDNASSLPAPTATHARLSDDGLGLNIYFDMPTSRPSNNQTAGDNDADYVLQAFECSNLLRDEWQDLHKASCIWKSRQELQVRLAAFAALSPGDEIEVIGNIIEASCRFSAQRSSGCPLLRLRTPATVVIIEEPSNPLPPAASVTVASHVGICDDIILDPTLSSGHGGRAWASIDWTVESRHMDMASIDIIQSYLKEYITNTSTLVHLPSSLMTDPVTITLTVVNFLGATSAQAVLVGRHQDTTGWPQVRIADVYNRLSFRIDNPLQLDAIIEMPSCGFIDTTVPAEYEWSFFRDAVLLDNITSVSADPHRLQLLPYAFEEYIAQHCIVQFTATFRNISGEAVKVRASKTLHLLAPPYRISIIGGSHRTVGAQLVKAAAVLNGFLSSAIRSNVSIEWYCVSFDLYSYGAPCNDGGNMSVTQIIADRHLRSEIELLLSAGTYQLRALAESAEATQIINVLPDLMPTIDIVQQNELELADATAKFRIEGTVRESSGADVQIYWSSDDLNLRTSSLTPTEHVFRPSFPVQAFDISLVIAADNVVHGASYTFTVRAEYVEDTSSTEGTFAAVESIIRVFVNSPPRGGALAVYPQSGFASETIFMICTSNWVDDADDLPLHYTFSYYTRRSSPGVVSGSDSTVPYVKATLGVAQVAADYYATLQSEVSDALGSSSAIDTPVEVRRRNDESNLLSIISTMQLAMGDANFLGEAAAVHRAIDTATLNALPGSVCRPSRPCAELMRERCGAFANTCGPCLPGYIGVTGDSNTPCQSVDTAIPVGGSCGSNSSCISNQCLRGKCTDLLRSCPNDCSNRGVCNHFDFRGRSVEFCSAFDSSCTVQCTCSQGFYGAACAYAADEYLLRLQLKEEQCHALRSTVTLSSLDRRSMLLMLQTVRQVIEEHHTVTAAALSNCSSVVIDAVYLHPQLSCESRVLPLLIDTLSLILGDGRNVSTLLLDRIENVLLQLSEGCHMASAINEVPASTVNERLRFLSVLHDGSKGNVSISLPLLASDKLRGIQPTQIVWALDDDTVIGLSAISFPSNVRGTSSDTSTLVLWYQSYDENRGRRALSETDEHIANDVILTFPNTEPVDYFKRQTTFQQLFCEEFDESNVELVAICPDDSTKTVNCEGRRGVYDITCPGRHEEPRCMSWNGDDYAIDSECDLVEYSAIQTSCVCHLPNDSIRYRALQSSSASRLEFATTTVFVDAADKLHFEYYPDLLDVEHTFVMLVSLVVVVFLFLLGLIVIFVSDKSSLNVEITAESRYSQSAAGRSIEEFFTSLLPNEFFDSGHWATEFKSRLLREHIYIRAFTAKQSKIQSSVQWMLAFGKVLSLVCGITAICFVFYADDGDKCESLETKRACADATSFVGYLPACKWETKNESCIFRRYDVSMDSVWLFTSIAFLVSASATNILEVLSKHFFKLTRLFFESKLHSASVDTSAADVEEFPFQTKDAALIESIEDQSIQPQKLEFCVQEIDLLRFEEVANLSDSSALGVTQEEDQFCSALKYKSRLFLAARLRKLNITSDFSLPYEEANYLVSASNAYFNSYGRRVLAVGAAQCASVLTSPTAARIRQHQLLKSRHQLQHRLEEVRNRAEFVKGNLLKVAGRQQREQLLMKYFIVDLFEGSRRAIAARYFLGTIQKVSYSKTYLCLRHAISCLFPLSLIAMLAATLYMQGSIGTRAADLWLWALITSLVLDILVLQPVKIWYKWLVVNSPVCREARNLCCALRRRCIAILNRRPSVVSDANAMIQHFNPACRVARLMPSLPVARLLIAMNDYDVPLFEVFDEDLLLPFIKELIILWNWLCAVYSQLLPFFIQDMLLELEVTASLLVIAYAVYLLWISQLLLAIVLILLILVTCYFLQSKYRGSMERWIRVSFRRERIRRRRQWKRTHARTLSNTQSHLTAKAPETDVRLLFKTKFASVNDDYAKSRVEHQPSSPITQHGAPSMARYSGGSYSAKVVPVDVDIVNKDKHADDALLTRAAPSPMNLIHSEGSPKDAAVKHNIDSREVTKSINWQHHQGAWISAPPVEDHSSSHEAVEGDIEKRRFEEDFGEGLTSEVHPFNADEKDAENIVPGEGGIGVSSMLLDEGAFSVVEQKEKHRHKKKKKSRRHRHGNVQHDDSRAISALTWGSPRSRVAFSFDSAVQSAALAAAPGDVAEEEDAASVASFFTLASHETKTSLSSRSNFPSWHY